MGSGKGESGGYIGGRRRCACSDELDKLKAEKGEMEG